jgi:branched-chain amino acid transport system substrate-binding protein
MASTLVRSLAALAAAALLAALPYAGAAQSQPIEIPFVGPLTGPAAFVGQTEAKGLGIFEDVINKAGGINGRPLKIDVQDDQTNPAVTVQLVSRIVAQRKAVMIGPVVAASVLAAMPLLKEGPVSVCFSPAVHPDDGSYVFTPYASTLDLAIATAHYVKKRGWKKIAFIFTTDANGADGEKVMTQAFAAPDYKDIRIVDIEHFAPADLSVSAQLIKIKGAEPDAVYVYSTGAPAATAIKGMREAGIELPVLTLWSNAGSAQLNAFKPYMPKELLIPGPPPMVPADQFPRGRLRDQATAYYKQFDAAGVKPDVLNAAAWDAAGLVVSALRRLGPNATAAQMREYIAGLRGYTGVSGTFDFKDIPQRGLDWKSGVLMARWDPARDSLVAASGLGGT